MRFLLIIGMSLGWALAWPSMVRAQATDAFVMLGADVNRPGLRANMNIGMGHTFAALRRNPLGDELTVAYTYENAGRHGFWHADAAEHTVAVGSMRNVPLRGRWGLYTWQQVGWAQTTGMGGGPHVYAGSALGGVFHVTKRHGIWMQETYNKASGQAWSTTTGIGYAVSF